MTPEKALEEFGTLYWSFSGRRVHITDNPAECRQVGGIEATINSGSRPEQVPLYRELCRFCDPDVEADHAEQRSQAELLREAGFEVETGAVTDSGVGGNEHVLAASEVADGD